MNSSPFSPSSAFPISATNAEEPIPNQIGLDEYPYSAKVATRVYEGVTLAAILLLLGSLWVF